MDGLYEPLRQFADSWGLLALTLIFLFVVAFVFRRGSTKRYEEAASIPLRDDTPVEDTQTKEDRT